jgi:RsiW-degrading membrane proteinase PrsW (M82 family)
MGVVVADAVGEPVGPATGGVGAATVPPDAWGRLARARRQWLRQRPRLARAVRVVAVGWLVASLAAFVAAWVTVPAWRDGVRLWLWGYVGLAVLCLAARTRTVAWRAVALTFSAGSALALPIGWVERPIADLVGAEVEFHDGAVLVAGPVEETLKLLPLVAVLLFARRRVRGFAVVDFLLLGYAAGLGFQVVEDAMRPLVDSTREGSSLAEVLLDVGGPQGPEASYGVTWLPGAWHLDLAGEAWFAGHAVLTGLVGVGIGLAYRLRRRVGPVVLLVPVALFAMVVVDHAMMNDVANRPFGDLGLDERMPDIDPESLPEGFELPPAPWDHEVDVPGWLRRAWELWGQGRYAAPLLTALLGVGLVLDARRTRRAVLARALPPVPTPPGIARLHASADRAAPGAGGVGVGGVGGAIGTTVATVAHDAVLTAWSVGREPPVTRVLDPATGAWRGSDGSLTRLDPATGAWVTVDDRGVAVAAGDEVEARRRRARRLRRWLVATAYLRARRRRAHHLEDAADHARRPPTLARRAGWVLAVAALVAGIVAVLAAVYGDRVTASASAALGEGDVAFLADLLRGLAEWWDGLSFVERTLVVLAVAGLLSFGFGWGFWVTFGVVDALTLVPEHGRGAADLIEDPEAAWNDYWEDLTWQRALWDGWEVATAIPGGGPARNLSDSWRSHIDDMAEGAAHQADDTAAHHADGATEAATEGATDHADDAAQSAARATDATPSRTDPSHAPDPNRTARGTADPLHPSDRAPENILAHQRQVESADTLAQAGYDVEHLHRGRQPGVKYPDYRIEGRIFDCKAPTSRSARNIAGIMEDSITDGQARRFVLNLDGSPVSLDALRAQLRDWPVSGLEEVIVVRGGDVVPLFP